MVRFSKCTRNTEPSEETTVAGISMPTEGIGNASRTSVNGARSTSSSKRMLVPPLDMSIVSPARYTSSDNLAMTGVITLMRTVVRNWRSSRATAVHTPRMTILNRHQITFMTTVPRRLVSQMKKRGMAMMSPAILKSSRMRNGCAILVSKKVRFTTPPLEVTLNLPSLGLMSASTVGSRMYGESTVS